MSEENQSGTPLQKGYKPIRELGYHAAAGYQPEQGKFDASNPPQGGSGVPELNPRKKTAKKD